MTGGVARCRNGWLVGVIGLAIGTMGTSGCVEVLKGPRVVTYTDASFYVRSAPMLNGVENVSEIATKLCGEQNRQAVLTDTYQDVRVGLRYSTFACL